MGIYIFSRPVHTGKTTALKSWCDKQNNVAGILMPDTNGSRKIYDIETGKFFDIECIDPANNKEPLTTVGRFHFYTSAFEKANAILLNALAKTPHWLLIDEAGKLELNGKGFHDALKVITDHYTKNPGAGNLLIAVRDSLCAEVISFYNIGSYKLITQPEDLD